VAGFLFVEQNIRLQWWIVGESGAFFRKVGESAMFMGEYQHSLDEKGRLIIPAKFRDGLGASFVLTRGLDHCLFVYPRSEWESLEAKLKSLPFTRADARAFSRFFFSGATECELDKQGRIIVPSHLREYAKLNRDAVVIGVSNRVEIWGKEEWESYTASSADNFAEIAEKLDFDF
jgi:MraZ protein